MKCLCKITLAAMMSLGVAGMAAAADHLDSPVVKGDPAADITDHFAFVNPDNPDELILIMDVVPLANATSAFSDVVNYSFHIDNGSGDQTITCTFPNRTQVECQGMGMSVSGPLNHINAAADLRVYAGLADDPFFFDFTAFNATKATLAAQFTNPGTDFFKGLDVMTIVLGINSDRLSDNGAHPVLKTFVSTERLAGAGLNSGFTGTWYDPANSGHGFNLQVLPPTESGGAKRVWMLWAVFDEQGKQMWVAGLGRIEGSDIIIDVAYRALGGAFPPGFSAGMPHAELWGSLTFHFDSCMYGTVHYDGSAAGFPSGDIALERLSRIDGLHCGIQHTGRLDRNGRPGVSTALIDLLPPYSETLKDAYNMAMMADWPSFTGEIEISLTALDTLDGVTGNSVLPPQALAPVLAADRLVTDVSIPDCGAYLAVELGVAGQCGGRTLAADVIDATLGAVVGPGVSDHVASDSDFRESFPFIGFPN